MSRGTRRSGPSGTRLQSSGDRGVLDQVRQSNDTIKQQDNPSGDVEPDALASPRLDAAPRGLANAGLSRGHPLRPPTTLAPLSNTLSNHVASDSNQVHRAQERSCSSAAKRLISSAVTASKRLPRDLADYLAALLKKRLDADFGQADEKGRRGTSTRAIQDKTGVPHVVLLGAMRGDGSVGVTALLAFRKYLQRPIDEILGLDKFDPLPGQGLDARMSAMENTIAALIARTDEPPPEEEEKEARPKRAPRAPRSTRNPKTGR